MFPGFNTEIDCAKDRFHIQTEVMTSPEPAILTLVYKAGAIITRVKRNYAEVLGDTPTQEELRYLAERQHRRVIDEVRAEHGSAGDGGAAPDQTEGLEEMIVEFLDFKGPSEGTR
jgi:hypothetical protein